MGFMDFLSPALTAASQGVGGYMQGQQQRRDREQDDATKMIQLIRQKRQDADAEALHQAQIENYASQKTERTAKGLVNKRARDSLVRAGVLTQDDVATDPNAEGGDYATQWKAYQTEDLTNKKTKVAQGNAKKLIQLHFKDSPLLSLPPQDQDDADWVGELATLKDDARQDRIDTRSAAQRAQSEENQLRSIAAMGGRQQIGIDAAIARQQNQPLPGEAQRMNRATQLADFRTALKQYEAVIDEKGTNIKPWSEDRATLGFLYESLTNNAKELYRMGALQQHEMIALRRALVDPISMTERAKSGGFPSQHVARIKAQLAQANTMLENAEKNLTTMGGYTPQTRGGQPMQRAPGAAHKYQSKYGIDVP